MIEVFKQNYKRDHLLGSPPSLPLPSFPDPQSSFPTTINGYNFVQLMTEQPTQHLLCFSFATNYCWIEALVHHEPTTNNFTGFMAWIREEQIFPSHVQNCFNLFSYIGEDKKKKTGLVAFNNANLFHSYHPRC